MSIPLIIDCDPGHDDAIALLLALASPEVDVLGVTTVGGNSGLVNTTRNALTVLEVAGRTEVPVAAGCDHPLVRQLEVADHVHGKTGMDGPVLDPPVTQPLDVHAVDFLAETIASSPEPLTITPIGPLTNIAMLLRHYPSVRDNIARIVLMGGAIGLGNRTPAAEFNIWSDPEAADVVFGAGLDVTMVGLDVTHQARMGRAHGERLRPMGRCGAFVADLLEFFVRFHERVYGLDSSPIHDAVAVADVIWPKLLEADSFHVAVETSSEKSRGRTLVDRWRVTGKEPNARVGLAIDGDRFGDLVVDRIGHLP
ncbi:MAG TPA: nucleoside hydrolase [Acidimicrobiia bacterium]|nr:nucleoside hydrolase [Acidimicrobiia bacterium]